MKRSVFGLVLLVVALVVAPARAAEKADAPKDNKDKGWLLHLPGIADGMHREARPYGHDVWANATMTRSVPTPRAEVARRKDGNRT